MKAISARIPIPELLLVVILLVCYESPGPAASWHTPESQAASTESDFSLKVNVDLVVLNLSVLDQNDRNVSNLKREDFELYEDNVLHPITEFLPTEAPFNLALVLDTSSSVQPKLPLIKKAGIEFVQQLRPNDRIGIAVFNSTVSQVLSFTSDRKLLQRTLDNLKVSKFGGSKVYDGVAQAVYRLREQSTGRNAIVILSDGMENASRIKFDGLRLLLAQSDAVLCPITVLSKQPKIEELESYIRSHEESDPYVANARASLAALSDIYRTQTQRLLTLAQDTGGKVFTVSDLSQLSGEYAKIAFELRNTYSVAYYPTNTRRDGTLRSVRILVKNPTFRVRARSSYFVPKEE